MVALILLFDLNVFFLKYALWVPPRNPLNTYRLVLWFLCALPAVREYYEYLQGNTGGGAGGGRFRKLGAFAWLAAAVSKPGWTSSCAGRRSQSHGFVNRVGLFHKPQEISSTTPAPGKPWDAVHACMHMLPATKG